MGFTANDIKELNEKIQYQGMFIEKLREEVGKVIIGQHYMDIYFLKECRASLKHLQSNHCLRQYMRNSAEYNSHLICCLPM